ncbi:MAG: molybdopterin cofactor-binding domain-containing protein [Bacteroidia bacterium]
MNPHKLSRRRFLFISGVSGTALAFGFFSGCDSPVVSSPEALAPLTDDPVAGMALRNFIVIDADNKITIMNTRPEIGQGSFQAVPAIIAEELEVNPSKIQIRQAPSDGKKYGWQGVGGSGTVRGDWVNLRSIGASARIFLISAAALQWSVSPEDCYAEDGKVINKKTNESLPYGSLIAAAAAFEQKGTQARDMLLEAAAAHWNTDVSKLYTRSGKVSNRETKESISYEELIPELESKSKQKGDAVGPEDILNSIKQLEIIENPPLKDYKDFKVIGKPLPRADIPFKVNGSAKFGIDEKMEGMLYASVERCPTFQGKVKGYDEAAALAVPGVKKVVRVNRKVFRWTYEGVAVVAENYWAALQGRKKLNVQWDNADMLSWDQEKIETLLRENLKKEGHIRRNDGDFPKAFKSAAQKLEAVYETPYLAHAPMEPLNALAHVQGDKCKVIVSTQSPNSNRSTVAEVLGIPEENVEFYVSFVGGGFGRRAFEDWVPEAALLSREMNAPVKVVWTREDDTTLGPFRPATYSAFKGGLDSNGNFVAYEHKMTGQHMGLQDEGADIANPSLWIMEGANEQYEIPNARSQYVLTETPVPVMWWRSVYASTNGFADEGFIDEMAHLAGRDPMEFRIKLCENEPRFKAVLETLSEKSGWKNPLPEGWGRGVAVVKSFGTIGAHVVEVSKKDKLKIERIVTVMDCGMYVNPDNVRAQAEGSVVMALTAALKPPITFKAGAAVESNFHQYQMLRIHECPPMEFYLMDNGENPGGVGEPALPALAPALVNAVFAATGKRIRRLPFDIDSI